MLVIIKLNDPYRKQTQDQARAKEVKDLCHKTAGCGPWSDRLRDHLTSNEVSEVKALWDTMPGYTSFYDAFMRFVQGRA